MPFHDKVAAGLGHVVSEVDDAVERLVKYGLPLAAAGGACYYTLRRPSGNVSQCLAAGAAAGGVVGSLTGGLSELAGGAAKEAGQTVSSVSGGFGSGLTGLSVPPALVLLLLAGLGALLIAGR
ncbi:MAG TPA: hypothetical protein VNN07_03920 [Candidatus Tectomicrobia bacterium]|nr:hypothetical protein [Candidatus Tectomicrobia bacterium]